ncbi:hypothetical protein PG997_010114 [Apiospora hydei]|uniref:Methyltransferase domain-containing protein n=1 Tax=Apiospora hydei TaxID=1337664 RepID=A0ABR1VW25_9PEZI
MAQSASATFDPSTYWTAPARNFRTSARLHMQHSLCQKTIGYLLDPTLPRGSPLRVADLGCGNGAWLCDLHDEFAKAGVSAQLDGYDINPVNFPAPAFLPSTVHLKQLDLLKPCEELTGLYDIVHVRAFGSTLAKTGVAPLLSVVLALLKPGGYLQWEESKVDRFLIESPPSAGIPSVACNTISRMLKAGSDGQGHDNSFIDKLDQVVTEYGFEDVHFKVFEKRKQDYKGWTEDFLMVWEELADMFPLKAQAPDSPVTRESFTELFQKAVAETEQGVAIHLGTINTVVGRKAM